MQQPEPGAAMALSRVYRDLNHLTAKKACSRPDLQGCSQDLAQFLAAFPRLQELGASPRDEQLDFITLALGMTRT